MRVRVGLGFLRRHVVDVASPNPNPDPNPDPDPNHEDLRRHVVHVASPSPNPEPSPNHEDLRRHVVHVGAAVHDLAADGHVLAHEGAAEHGQERDEELACPGRGSHV